MAEKSTEKAGEKGLHHTAAQSTISLWMPVSEEFEKSQHRKISAKIAQKMHRKRQEKGLKKKEKEKDENDDDDGAHNGDNYYKVNVVTHWRPFRASCEADAPPLILSN